MACYSAPLDAKSHAARERTAGSLAHPVCPADFRRPELRFVFLERKAESPLFRAVLVRTGFELAWSAAPLADVHVSRYVEIFAVTELGGVSVGAYGRG